MTKRLFSFLAILGFIFALSACMPNEENEDTPDDNQEDVITDNIIETATDAGTFNTLLAAIEEANLTAALSDETASYTVFAPTDQAFTTLLTALDIDAATLLGVNNLSDILLYHVIEGEYAADDVLANAPFSMETLQGTEVEFTVMDGNVYINDAQIITTDIVTTNGIIHVIEEVILPLENIVDTAEAAGSFTTLLAALDTAELTDTLAGEGSFTVFAPTDDAFLDLMIYVGAQPEDLLGVSNLADILTYHVLDGAYYSTDVVAGAPFSMATLNGEEVDFTVSNGQAYINGVRILTTDILTTNGVIHVIEEVILPQENIVEAAQAAGTFTTLLAAAEAAGLADTLANSGFFTVFAPTDQAFADLLTALDVDAATLLGVENLADILLYHIIQGPYYSTDVVSLAPYSFTTLNGMDIEVTVMDGVAYMNGAEIVTTDILTRNGIIHVIDEVLLPLDNIIDTAEAAGSFTTLLAALDTAELTATLEAAGSYTVFAPTDQAFADLLTALDIDAATLLGVSNLSDILLYHVLDGAYYSTDVVSGAPFSMATLEGSTVDFTVMDGVAYINGVEIVTTDLLTTNGVIHVINEVILPLEDIVATATANGNFTTLLTALDQEGLTTTLQGDGPFTVFAPTDQAFADLLVALDITVEQLLALENLDQILLYHVLSGTYYSTDVVAAAPLSLASVQGSNLDFTVMNGMVYVNGTEVVLANILTSNGVIHVVGEVLLYE